MGLRSLAKAIKKDLLSDYGVWPVASCALYGICLGSVMALHHFVFSPDVSLTRPMPYLQVDENTHTAGRYFVDKFALGTPALYPGSRAFFQRRWEDVCRVRQEGPSPYRDFEVKEEL
eukprot:Rmarinus@m.17044